MCIRDSVLALRGTMVAFCCRPEGSQIVVFFEGVSSNFGVPTSMFAYPKSNLGTRKSISYTKKLKGTISEKIKGSKGFGYDAIFIPEKKNKTFGQMTRKSKIKPII